ncbi:MAG: FAD-dependent oxidoreductase, partial [Candidatus Thorarchaeota archaeon]|nr:FAD-dependent oxidoreductase [Candidatus Thorarchaeota archaeon]
SDLKKVVDYVGVNEILSNYVPKERNLPIYSDDPLFIRDLDKCILCGRCVRMCQEIRGIGAIGLINRGIETFVGTTKDSELKESGCKFCRACVEVCPSGALVDKSEWNEGTKREVLIPCQYNCPAETDIPRYVRYIAEGRYQDSLAVIRSKFPFPYALGLVCNHPCETACSRIEINKPISIRELKRFVAERDDGSWKKHLKISKNTGKKVAIVGAGPSGLTAAWFLKLKGYDVTVFEMLSKPGGMLKAGIPDYRLPPDVLEAEIKEITDIGVKIKYNTKIESTKALFSKSFDSIYLSMGAPKGMNMGLEGEEDSRVLDGIETLGKINFGEETDLKGNVAVVGGGNVAIDIARCSIRMGVEKVNIIYRRTREEMPAYEHEIQDAIDEGVELLYLTNPTKILEGKEKLKVECIKMELGKPDDSGRRRPVLIPESEYKMSVDTVIMAVGQQVTSDALLSKLAPTQWGTLEVDPVTLATNVKGVFGGGDVVSGGSTVIEAVATGKEAAKSIDRFLRRVDLVEGRDEILTPIEDIEVDGSIKIHYAPAMRTLSMSKRKTTFDEVELGFNKATAVAEAERCLSCAICCECMKCVEACKLDAVDHSLQDEIVELDVGTIIVATGFKIYDPHETREFGYGTFENVITNAQLERLTNAAGPTQGKPKRPSDHTIPKRVAFVQCVGSRDKRIEQDYCCYIGCANSLKQAIQLKEKYHEIEVTVYAMDIRTHGLGYEGLYNRARAMGVLVVKGRPSEIEEVPDTKSLIVFAEDLYTGNRLETTTDLVVLATALVPNDDTPELARKMKLSTGEYGFLMEAHPKLRPVDSFQDGVFLAGAALGPMDIPKAVAYGKGAAAGAQALMAPGKFYVEPIYAEIDTDLCFDCDLCSDMCPYGAITGKGEERKVMFELCQGCGTCAGGCPKNAIDMRHYRRQQILPQILAAAKVQGELVL